MTAAVVHIGLPKTGTTSFQSACRSQADALADVGAQPHGVHGEVDQDGVQQQARGAAPPSNRGHRARVTGGAVLRGVPPGLGLTA